MRTTKQGFLIESTGIYWQSSEERHKFNLYLLKNALKKGHFISRAILEKIERESQREEKQNA